MIGKFDDEWEILNSWLFIVVRFIQWISGTNELWSKAWIFVTSSGENLENREMEYFYLKLFTLWLFTFFSRIWQIYVDRSDRTINFNRLILVHCSSFLFCWYSQNGKYFQELQNSARNRKNDSQKWSSVCCDKMFAQWNCCCSTSLYSFLLSESNRPYATYNRSSFIP